MMMWTSWTNFVLIITCTLEVTCNGWSTVFIVPKSQTPVGYSSIQQLWEASGSYGNGWNFRSAIDTNVIFKSPILDVWNVHNVLAVKLSAYKNNKEEAYVVFNATGKTKHNWFECDNILNSSYTDIKSDDIRCNMNSVSRRWKFEIKQSNSGCQNDAGWLMLKDFDASNYCPEWNENMDPTYFYYSKKNTYATWSTPGDRGIADAMVISLSMVHVALSRAEAVVNGSTTIYCGSTAFQIIGVTWKRGDKNIQNVSRYSGGDTTTPSLTISDLQMSDAGAYTCILTTTDGTGEDSVILNVIERRDDSMVISDTNPVVLVDLQSSTAVVNGQTTIDCVSTVFSITKVTWRKNGEVIQISGSPRYSGGNKASPSLTISNLNKSDEGMYTCILTTAIWTGQDSVELIVIDRPSVNVHLSPEKPVVDSHTTIHCNSSDFPVTNVSWTKDGYNIESLSCDKYCGGNKEIPSLTIHYLNMSDSGEYTCTLTNSVGSANGNVNLSVIAAPVVNVTLSSALPTGNNQTTIYCDSTEFEVTHVSWEKDGEDIMLTSEKYSGGNLTTPSLTIHSLKRNDTGEYTCMLTNAAGYNVKSVTLTVIVSPVVEVNVLPYNMLQADGEAMINCACTKCMATKVTWEKDGDQINVWTKKYSKGSHPSASTLTIHDIQTSDTGIYTCILTNAVGIGQNNVKLTVVDTNVFRPESSNQLEKIRFWLNSTNQQRNFKKIEQKELRKLKKTLEVRKKNITSFKRKKISASDRRMSSAATGYIGAALLVVVLGSIVLGDIFKLVKFMKSLKVEHKDDESQ